MPRIKIEGKIFKLLGLILLVLLLSIQLVSARSIAQRIFGDNVADALRSRYFGANFFFLIIAIFLFFIIVPPTREILFGRADSSRGAIILVIIGLVAAFFFALNFKSDYIFKQDNIGWMFCSNQNLSNGCVFTFVPMVNTVLIAGILYMLFAFIPKLKDILKDKKTHTIVILFALFIGVNFARNIYFEEGGKEIAYKPNTKNLYLIWEAESGKELIKFFWGETHENPEQMGYGWYCDSKGEMKLGALRIPNVKYPNTTDPCAPKKDSKKTEDKDNSGKPSGNQDNSKGTDKAKGDQDNTGGKDTKPQ